MCNSVDWGQLVNRAKGRKFADWDGDERKRPNKGWIPAFAGRTDQAIDGELTTDMGSAGK